MRGERDFGNIGRMGKVACERFIREKKIGIGNKCGEWYHKGCYLINMWQADNWEILRSVGPANREGTRELHVCTCCPRFL